MLITADAHCDTLFSADAGCTFFHVTPETNAAGNVGLQTFALFSGEHPPLHHGMEQAVRQVSFLPRLGFPPPADTLPEALSVDPLTVLSVEGAEILEDSFSALERLRNLGVRLMNLTWNHENSVGMPAALGRGHLKSFGKALIREMNRLGVLADVSHLNEDGFFDTIEYSSLPVIASHSCVKHLTDHFRNLSDTQIRLLIAQHGFIGINFCPEFLHPSGSATINDIAHHIDYIVQMGGLHTVGIGSDFDGIAHVPACMENSSCFPKLWALLSARGYTEKDLRLIAGENYYSVLKKTEVYRHA